MARRPELREDEIDLPDGERAVAARTLLEERMRSVRRTLDRELAPIDVVLRPTRPESRSYLFEEACELYLNELNWEELTDEERVDDGALTEMVFPGLLTLLDALLPRSESGEPDRDREHRDVVHDFVLWLAARLVGLRNVEAEDRDERIRVRREAEIADDLLDLVIARLYGLDEGELTTIRG
jgi:hypothetical protein